MEAMVTVNTTTRRVMEITKWAQKEIEIRINNQKRKIRIIIRPLLNS